ERRPADARAVAVPESCPVCGSAVERTQLIKRSKGRETVSEGSIYRCVGRLACQAQLKQAIIHFVSRRAMDIDGLGDKIVEQLVDKELIRSPADLYCLTFEQVVALEGFAEVSSRNLLKSIEASRTPTLARFIYALGIPDVGEETAKLLARALGSLERVARALPDVLVYLPDVGLEVAHEIHSFFQDEHNRLVIEQLRERGVQLQEEGDLHPEFAACATLAGLIDKLDIPFIARTGAQRLADRFGSLEAIIGVGLEVAHEIHSFFQDEHNRLVIEQLRERGVQLQEEGDLHPEFAACATLAGLIDKLDIPFIARTGAQRLADRFGSLEAIIGAD